MVACLESYRARIEMELQAAVEKMGDPSRLRDACAYALLNGGKRLRPIFTLLVAEGLGQRNVMTVALGVEYFHTASLIADDLPCMDNDALRRHKPSLHIAFEESTAILASYTLIAAGYGSIHEMGRQLKQELPLETAHVDAIMAKCLETVSQCAGLRGAAQGQFLDLFPPDETYETAWAVIQQKTATLFEISFVLGWLFGGGDVQRLERVRKCAEHVGIAFQIADDLKDVSTDKRLGLPQLIGEEQTRNLFTREMGKFILALKELQLWTEPFQHVCRMLESYSLTAS